MDHPREIAFRLLSRNPESPPLRPITLLKLAHAEKADLAKLEGLLNHLRSEGGRLAQHAEYLHQQLGPWE